MVFPYYLGETTPTKSLWKKRGNFDERGTKDRQQRVSFERPSVTGNYDLCK